MPGAGKSEAVLIAKEEGYPVFRMGDCIMEEVKARGLPLDDKNVGPIATEMRKTNGYDIWAKRTYEKIRTSPDVAKCRCVVIDGVRNVEEAVFFRSVFDDFKLVAVDAPFEQRCERLIKRGRSDAPQTAEDCKRRDERELSWGLGKLIEKADLKIENTGTLEEFRTSFREIFDKIA